MTLKPSLLLIRTQAALRIVTSLDASQQRELTEAEAELALIERILTRTMDVPEALFEAAVLDILDKTLQSALHAIDGLIPEEGNEDTADLEVTNADRARWAKQALEAYAGAKEGRLYDEPSDMFVDLLCDLMHFADRITIDFETSLETAECHYRLEIDDRNGEGAS